MLHERSNHDHHMAASCTCHLLAARQQPHEKAKLFRQNVWEFSGKKVKRMDHRQKNYKTERAWGLGWKTRGETGKRGDRKGAEKLEGRQERGRRGRKTTGETGKGHEGQKTRGETGKGHEGGGRVSEIPGLPSGVSDKKPREHLITQLQEAHTHIQHLPNKSQWCLEGYSHRGGPQGSLGNCPRTRRAGRGWRKHWRWVLWRRRTRSVWEWCHCCPLRARSSSMGTRGIGSRTDQVLASLEHCHLPPTLFWRVSQGICWELSPVPANPTTFQHGSEQCWWDRLHRMQNKTQNFPSSQHTLWQELPFFHSAITECKLNSILINRVSVCPSVNAMNLLKLLRRPLAWRFPGKWGSYAPTVWVTPVLLINIQEN